LTLLSFEKQKLNYGTSCFWTIQFLSNKKFIFAECCREVEAIGAVVVGGEVESFVNAKAILRIGIQKV
jgi:hypothetical protein